MPYKTRRRKSVSRKLKIVMLACFAVTAALVVGAVLLMHQERIAENAVAAERFTPKPLPVTTTEAPPERLPVVAAMERLADTSRPFIITVLGDSTGAPAGSWVELIGQRLGETYDRPVTFHGWSLDPDPDGYLSARDLTAGSNAPITIWNGSAAGQDPAYTLGNLEALAPAESSDLVFVNHGHNARPGELASDAGDLLEATSERYPAAAVAVILQNPENPDYGNATNHAANLADLTRLATRQGYPVVDVYSAYPDGALEDDVHPNAEGFQAWAETVWNALT